MPSLKKYKTCVDIKFVNGTILENSSNTPL